MVDSPSAMRGEHGIAMRDRFVAGHADASGGAGSRGNRDRIGGRAEHAPHYSIRTLDGIRFSMLFNSRAFRDRCTHPFRLRVTALPTRARAVRMLNRGGTVRLQIHSNFDMVDFVQVVSDRVGQLAGLDEDTVHWIGVAVRESVINAIKHGNREDSGKIVTVEFAVHAGRRSARAGRARRSIRARGSSPTGGRRSARAREHPEIERPRHLLHAQLHGRRRAAARRRDGGMEVRMVKKLATGA